jgi:Pilus formation protein N terminal region
VRNSKFHLVPASGAAFPMTRSPSPKDRIAARSHRTLTTIACLVSAAILMTQAAHARDLVVRYDQSQLLRLPRPVSEVIIGNPSIADVTIQGGNLLVITGKTFGITNIIALDDQRNVIQDQRVIVERDEQRMLVLYRGAERESYSCTPSCSPTITIGDDRAFFDTISKHVQTKTGVSGGGAGPAPQGQ